MKAALTGVGLEALDPAEVRSLSAGSESASTRTSLRAVASNLEGGVERTSSALVPVLTPSGQKMRGDVVVAGSWEAKTTRSWLLLTSSELDERAATAFCRRDDVGAVVSFLGTVRDHAPGIEGVRALHYEVALELAAARLEEIAHEAFAELAELRELVIHHRLGRVELGLPAVIVAAGAPHRDVAFRAARYAIDAVKVAVPLVKQEISATGARWSPDATALTTTPHLKDMLEP